jgi:hypothetical protein
LLSKWQWLNEAGLPRIMSERLPGSATEAALDRSGLQRAKQKFVQLKANFSSVSRNGRCRAPHRAKRIGFCRFQHFNPVHIAYIESEG